MNQTVFLLPAKFLKFTAIVAVMFFGTASCSSDEKKPPIKEEKFQEILTEIHVMQTKLESFKAINDTSLFAAVKGHQEIFSKHGVTKEQFNETFNFYISNPKQMDKMYEKIIDELSVKEAKSKEQ
jgi:hypothetical protein